MNRTGKVRDLASALSFLLLKGEKRCLQSQVDLFSLRSFSYGTQRKKRLTSLGKTNYGDLSLPLLNLTSN